MPPLDTAPEAEAVQIAVYRRLTDGQRLSLTIKGSVFARDLALAGLRQQHPGWTESDAKREFLRRQFPPDQIPPPLR